MTKKIENTTVFVNKQFFSNKEEKDSSSDEEVVQINKFVTDTVRVGLEYGLTLNLGNYETARVSVSISVPCYKEETEEAYAYAKEYIETKIQEEVSSVRKHSKR